MNHQMMIETYMSLHYKIWLSFQVIKNFKNQENVNREQSKENRSCNIFYTRNNILWYFTIEIIKTKSMTKMTEFRPKKTGLYKYMWVTLLLKVIFDHNKI